MTTTTIDLTAILEETERLNQLLIRSEEAKQYRECKARLRQDEEAQKLIRQFVKKKEALEEVERFGPYHPDYHRVKQEVRQLKRTLDLQESIANFKQAERALESVLREVSKIIAHAVSETIKVSTGNPYFDQIGCGGGCSGRCSNCGNRD